jgi:hypothetical protein
MKEKVDHRINPTDQKIDREPRFNFHQQTQSIKKAKIHKTAGIR